MSNDIILPIGLSLDTGDLIIDPYPNLSRLVIGSTGAAKTTSVVMPTIQSLMGNTDVSVCTYDVKDGECYPQIKPVAEKYGRSFGCFDDMAVYGWDNPDRIITNPFGCIVSAAKHNPDELIFTIQSATHNIIPEVNDGGRNFYFRESPRQEIHTGILCLHEFLPNDVRPGMLYEMMSDPEIWYRSRINAVEDGSPELKARAMLSLDMQENEPEGYYKHLRAALTPMQIYSPSSSLNQSGVGETHTHEELCSDGWLTHFILPQRYAKRVGIHMALHQQCMSEAQLSGRGGRLISINDEMTNSPQKSEVELVTIQRSYSKSCIYLAQTFTDIEKQYGEKEAAILLDNCAVKQYLSITNYADAEKISKAMGEEISVSQSMNVNPERLEISGSISTGKQPVMTPSELMNLDPSLQVTHMKGFGWFVSRKLFQNQILPTARYLGSNPMEGDPMAVDPKIELPVPNMAEAA